MPYIDYVSSILGRERKEVAKTYQIILDEMVLENLQAGDVRIVQKYEWLRDKMKIAKADLGISYMKAHKPRFLVFV